MRGATSVAVALLCAGSLTACGGDDYCDTLQGYDDDAGLQNTNFRTQQGLETVRDVFEDLSESAPSELGDDYAAVLAGVRAAVEGSEQDIDRAAVQEGYQAIAADAQERCDVAMG